MKKGVLPLSKLLRTLKVANFCGHTLHLLVCQACWWCELMEEGRPMVIFAFRALQPLAEMADFTCLQPRREVAPLHRWLPAHSNGTCSLIGPRGDRLTIGQQLTQ